MATNALNFKCAVITGGAGGIGFALAKWFISEGKQVIIVGRTESKLQEAAKNLGSGTVYYVLDTGDIENVPGFVKMLVSEHPEVDCLVNNAGVQQPLDFKDFDLAKADQEINVNIRGPMHLAVNLLPHLKTKPAAAIMNVSSVLGFNPFSVVNPVYNGTKAWLHFHTMNMRTQLKDTNIKVVEIIPPMVGTDLHREREDPDDNKKEKNPSALSIEEFMDDITKGLKENKDVVTAGKGHKVVGAWYAEFGKAYEQMTSS